MKKIVFLAITVFSAYIIGANSCLLAQDVVNANKKDINTTSDADKEDVDVLLAKIYEVRKAYSEEVAKTLLSKWTKPPFNEDEVIDVNIECEVTINPDGSIKEYKILKATAPMLTWKNSVERIFILSNNFPPLPEEFQGEPAVIKVNFTHKITAELPEE